MAKNNSGVKLAPFVPLALGLLMQNAVLPDGRARIDKTVSKAPIVECEDVESFVDCHNDYPTGCTDKPGGRYDPFLNLMKNQLLPAPADPAALPYLNSSADFAKLDRKLPEGLGKKNHGDFQKELAAMGEGQIIASVGFLYYLQEGTAETSNCKLTGEENADFHLGIGYDAGLAEKLRSRKALSAEEKRELKRTSVIVEMTPHVRFANGTSWNKETLRKAVGRKVRVAGQLMFDNEHNIASQNCAMTGADQSKCWRATAWEMHPVTLFQVCADESCTEKTGDWKEVE
ncbi:MAG: hypothetical protein JNK48_28500 [Bryobacterales bacterium]|nr:hypothetical protein [Bryobacterales bacterium]